MASRNVAFCALTSVDRFVVNKQLFIAGTLTSVQYRIAIIVSNESNTNTNIRYIRFSPTVVKCPAWLSRYLCSQFQV